MGLLLALLGPLAVLGSAPAAHAQPRIRLERGGFVVESLPDGASAGDFAVYVDGADEPILGTASLSGAVLRFEPRFPLAPGLRYRAVLRAASPTAQVFEIPPAAAAPTPRVERVDPSGDPLPQNLLRFYLHFSEPMSRGEAYRRVHLLDAAGAAVQAPFLELEQELWDPAGVRLTLLLDPGRIKRGLLPNEQVGLALEPGRSYTLAVDAGWPSAAGVPLAAGFRKEFRVVPPDREPPDPRTWKLQVPAPGSRDALAVVFPEPLDRALLESLFSVRSGRAQLPAASVVVDRNETRWRFTPRDPWRAGDYTLCFDAALEDVAGNRIGRPFDVDLEQPSEAAAPLQTLPFRVK